MPMPMPPWVPCLFAVACGCTAQEMTAPHLPKRVEAGRAVVIAHVNLLPMTGKTPLLRDQTVVVRDGLIEKLGNGVAIPAGAVVVDGSGRYLMPGLIDSHTHIRYARDLTMYLDAGVTTVFTLGQSPRSEAMQARSRIERGEQPGPRVFAAVFLDGPGSPIAPAADVAAIRGLVASARSDGQQLVKLYNQLTPAQFDTAIAEAHKAGLAVFGHAVRSVPLPYALAHGQQVLAHVEEYLYSYLGNREDDTRIAAAAHFTRESATYVIPNLSAYDAIAAQWGKPDWLERLEPEPEFKRLHAGWQAVWRSSDYVKRTGTLGTRPQFLRRLTRALADSGVPLMAGTDSPFVPGLYPGTSLYAELRTLVDAGLSPADALRAATRTPGEFLSKTGLASEPVGQIVPGARADLLLLDRNPLQNIENVRSVVGIMTKGEWYSKTWLDSVMVACAALMAACSESSSPGPIVPTPTIAGTYQTSVSLTANTCTGITVQDNPTVVGHTTGASAITLTHAGSTYSGTLAQDSTFITAPNAITVGTATHTITLAGKFRPNTFTADATSNVTGTGSGAPCQYVVHWVGTK
jgi:hypothetical protein